MTVTDEELASIEPLVRKAATVMEPARELVLRFRWTWEEVEAEARVAAAGFLDPKHVSHVKDPAARIMTRIRARLIDACRRERRWRYGQTQKTQGETDRRTEALREVYRMKREWHARDQGAPAEALVADLVRMVRAIKTTCDALAGARQR